MLLVSARAAAQARARDGVEAGAFSVFSVAPRNDTQQGVVRMAGGWDAARDGAIFESEAEALIGGPLSLRAGVSAIDGGATVRPLAGARVLALTQARHGVDLAVSAGYEPFGFNTVPALASSISLARHQGRLTLLANLGHGLGLQEGEHAGDLRAAALVRLARGVRVGLDARGRLDLERDQDEPEGEPDYELSGMPAITLDAGPFAVTAGAGATAVRRRLESTTTVAPMAVLGVSAVF